MDFFDTLRATLDDSLPSWWAHRDATSELSIMLQVFADMADELAAQVEAIYADQALSTATEQGLATEWASLYGAEQEQLSPTVNVLRSYLQARAREDGSVESLQATLLAILDNGFNVFKPTTGYVTFPADGSGLVFPSDGTGIKFPATDLSIVEHPATRTWEVRVNHLLVFDRPAFQRAVDRFRLAHLTAATITET